MDISKLKKANNILSDKFKAYRRKYYLNKIVKGIILIITILLTTYLILNSIEFSFQVNSIGRTIMFFSYIVMFIMLFYYWLYIPISKLYNITKSLSDEKAARQIGELFIDLKDKLLNTIQLSKSSNLRNTLITASIEQRTKALSVFNFSSGIKISANKKYLKYVAYPGIILILILFFVPHFLTESTGRIINFDKEYTPQKLFSISLLNKSLTAFKNEDFTFKIRIESNVIPENFYVNTNSRRVKMIKTSENVLNYTFQKVQANLSFHIEAAGYISETYLLEVYTRPDIKNFNIKLNYPEYILRKNEILTNTGNLLIPEGTKIIWLIKTISSDKLQVSFSPDYKKIELQNIGNQLFTYNIKAIKDENYQLHLSNEHSENKDKIKYHIEVIKDKFPVITLNTYQDTTLFSYLILGGNISDDYGIKNLELVYKITYQNQEGKFQNRKIPISKKLKSQNYFYQWILDSLNMEEGDNLEYFIRVWDNDDINGSKFTKTKIYQFKIPTKKVIKEHIHKQAESAEKQLGETLERAKDLKKQIEDIQNKLKSKRNFNWQDKKQLNELIKQKEKLEEELKKLSEQNKAYLEKKERFSKQNKKLQEKARQLQKLMDEVLDEETKKLYNELQKLLEEQKGLDEVQNLIKQIENNENNVEREIERALELFKRLQFDYKMEDIINELDELSKKQEDLSEETKDKSNDIKELEKKQEKLNERFDDAKEEMDKLEELNKNMKNPERIDDMSEQEEEISEDQQKSLEQLKQKKRKKASQFQKNASDKMKKMKKNMQSMQAGMEMEILQENLDNLRNIIDNLVKVSFDQENIIHEFKNVNQSDPRYVSLSQRQLKLRDNSRIIEDSLIALASRVFQIASFITRELDDMNDYIESSLQALKDRKRQEAMISQQYAMTSINNLALLLDDVLQQMQQQMADAMGKPQKGKGKSQKIPGLSQLQQQLNDQISDLKKSGKSGRKLSEELAKMAAQQEMIRKQLQEMQELLNEEDKNGGGSGLKDAIKKMEETENDLVNKQITQQTLKRQQDILTRLLKAEDAMRERELDDKREAIKVNKVPWKIPPSFEEYLKVKKQEIELLKTIPLKLNSYYKEEVNKYFKRLSEQ